MDGGDQSTSGGPLKGRPAAIPQIAEKTIASPK